MVPGTVDLLVLKALAFGPRHGYAVAKWVRETTGGRLRLEEGALYTALHRLARRGLLESEWGESENRRRARFYTLSARGRAALDRETREWSEYAAAVAQVLSATEAGA
jgi:PadR family transcriptional regulator, regulatory protein PadR